MGFPVLVADTQQYQHLIENGLHRRVCGDGVNVAVLHVPVAVHAPRRRTVGQHDAPVERGKIFKVPICLIISRKSNETEDEISETRMV